MADTTISDEILQKAQEDITKRLNNETLSHPERVQLEIQSYFLVFLVTDHKRIGKIYPWVISQQEKEKSRKIWWDKLQWVVIPFAVTAILAFLGQAFIFWIKIVPELSKLGIK